MNFQCKLPVNSGRLRVAKQVNSFCALFLRVGELAEGHVLFLLPLFLLQRGSFFFEWQTLLLVSLVFTTFSDGCLGSSNDEGRSEM